MGGGALMIPALIFLHVGEASTVVTTDLTDAAVYKSGGGIMHAREGKPKLQAGRLPGRRFGPLRPSRPPPRALVHPQHQSRARQPAEEVHRIRLPAGLSSASIALA